ncbi:hypothetical protein CRG98_024083 [Punica granatum]|uniref:Uncharacterized protein n=1 Tax=Punica granatum TaxID=22663 RepID=A0A2I0JGU2_PUNGR|nr:hypothetical protein CRG98_024083 [Punica granatum]
MGMNYKKPSWRWLRGEGRGIGRGWEWESGTKDFWESGGDSTEWKTLFSSLPRRGRRRGAVLVGFYIVGMGSRKEEGFCFPGLDNRRGRLRAPGFTVSPTKREEFLGWWVPHVLKRELCAPGVRRKDKLSTEKENL